MSNYILTLIADEKFYLKNPKDFSDKFLNSGDKGGFSGIAIYSDLNGYQMRVDKYIDGVLDRGVFLSTPDTVKLKRRLANANGIVRGIRLRPVKKEFENTTGIQKSLPFCYVCWVEHSSECEKEAFDDIIITPSKPEKPWVDPLGGADEDQASDGETGGGDSSDNENTEDNGGGPATDPADPDTPDLPFPKYIHDKIIDSIFINTKLKKTDINLIKNGSEIADSDIYQDTLYNHMHAMRRPGETISEAIASMRNYFILQIKIFKSPIGRNYTALGMALHPIMDAYASPHENFQIFDASLAIC